jgi:hypothetical protein
MKEKEEEISGEGEMWWRGWLSSRWWQWWWLKAWVRRRNEKGERVLVAKKKRRKTEGCGWFFVNFGLDLLSPSGHQLCLYL